MPAHSAGLDYSFGSFCFSTSTRRLNVEVPDDYWELMSSKPTASDFAAHISKLSDELRDTYLRAQIVSYHELTHFHQLLGSVAGLQAMEMSSIILDGSIQALRENGFDRRRVHEAFAKADYEHVKKASDELNYCLAGNVCRVCYAHLFPPLEESQVMALQGVPELSMELTRVKNVSIIRYVEPQRRVGFPVASMMLVEALSSVMEAEYASLIFDQIGMNRPDWYPFQYGTEYDFLTRLVSRICGASLPKAEIQILTRDIAWLSLNAGGTSFRSGKNHSGVKLFNIIVWLWRYHEDFGQAPDLQELQRGLKEMGGYIDLGEVRQDLLSNATNKLSLSTTSSLGVLNQSLIEYYKAQSASLEGGLSESIVTGEHPFRMSEYPAVPFSIITVAGNPNRKKIAMNSWEKGLWAYLYFFLHDIIGQAREERVIRCPLKVEGVTCTRADDSCGCVLELKPFRATRGCTFELMIESLVRESPIDLLNHVEFISELIDA